MDAAGYGIKVSGEDRYWSLRTEWLTRQGNRFAARLLKEHNVLLRASQYAAFPSIAGSAVGEGASGDGLRARG